MREAHSGPSSAACPAYVRSEIPSFILGRMSRRHSYLSESFLSGAPLSLAAARFSLPSLRTALSPFIPIKLTASQFTPTSYVLAAL